MSYLLLSNWFERNGFEVWKLKTAGDWFFFLLILFGGFFIFWLVARRMKKNRTPERAAQRVEKKLKRLGGKNAKVYRNIVIKNSKAAAECEMLFLAPDRINLVKVINKGTQVKGQMGSKNWTVYFNSGSETMINPLIPLQKQKDVLNFFFVENHLGKIPINPLVVFADTYSYPHIQIFGFAGALPLQGLRKWFKKEHPFEKEVKWKRARVEELLDQAMADSDINRFYINPAGAEEPRAAEQEEKAND